ncbi:MAG: general secretion pathway protein GspM [Alteromonadaceae bacterium]|nr:MAG: general secretion pathway protein GspM [Alteromonadaceae bacterium]
MNALKEWWEQASSKDQLYLVAGGGCLALYLLFVGVLQPIQDKRDKQMVRLQAQQDSLERVRVMAAQYQANKESSNTANTSGGNVENIVQRSLSPAGLSASSMDASGGSGVRLRFNDAPFDKVLDWLYDMEVSQGLQVRDLNVANGEGTGTVSVNIRLHQE